MGRKPISISATPDSDPLVITGADAHIPVSRTPASLVKKEVIEANERDLLNQLLGQAQMADAFSKFSKTVFISKLSFVKENKLYQYITNNETEDGLQLKGTWEEFCNLLGWAPQHANEAIANLNSFGEEALDAMSRMGIGYREMRQYRKLPEDQRLALIEAAKDGDKATLIDLAEDLISKHIKEKESLSVDLDISRQSLQEKKEVVQNLMDENDKLNTQLRQRTATETSEQEGMAIRSDATHAAYDIKIVGVSTLNTVFEALREHSDRTQISHSEFMAGLLNDIEHGIKVLRSEFSLPEHEITHDERPDWLDAPEPGV